MPYWKLVLILTALLLVGWVIAENAATTVRLRFFGMASADIPFIVVLMAGILAGALLAAPSVIRVYRNQATKRKVAVQEILDEVAPTPASGVDRPPPTYEPADHH